MVLPYLLLAGPRSQAGCRQGSRAEQFLAYSEAPLVSSNIVGSSTSCVFDAGLTKVIDARHVKVAGWYDNESGFCHRLIDTALLVAA